MNRFGVIVLAIVALAWCDAPAANSGHEPVVGGPCEGCEAVFEGIPDSLAWNARIATTGPGATPLRIEGVVRERGGRPAPGVIVYAYHTDERGIYPRDDRYEGHAARHGRLRAWVRTDAKGRYRFDTIRPGGYPGTNIPEHVHMHIIEPGRGTYYINDVHFEDDPRLTGEMKRRMPGRGGNGVVAPTRNQDGAWIVARDIVLGENVPGYPDRSAKPQE